MIVLRRHHCDERQRCTENRVETLDDMKLRDFVTVLDDIQCYQRVGIQIASELYGVPLNSDNDSLPGTYTTGGDTWIV